MSIFRETSKVARSEINNLLQQAQALVDATAGEQEVRIKAARDALGDRLKSAKDMLHQAEGRVGATFRAADAAVREQPYYAIGGACLGGLLFGWLLARRPQ